MKLLLIDSNALFHRSRSALTRAMGEMTTSYGIPVTGTYGFLNAMFSIMAEHGFDCVVPVYDKGGNWRKEESESYKANRASSEIAHRADMSLLIKSVLPELGMTPIGLERYEADDIIAHISTNSSAFSEIYILTCDRDLFQLVSSDGKVKIIFFTSAKKIETIDEKKVESHFCVKPCEVKYVKALCGDSSDNISGIKGIGPKTALKVILEAKESNVNPDLSLADKICFHPKVKADSGKFLSNLRLVTLQSDIPNLRWFASSPIPKDQVEKIFQELEFKSFLKPSRFSKICSALRATE